MHDTFKKFDLKGKTAFITGGGTGLGYYMSRGLACLGAKVMIASRREDVLIDAAKKLTVESSGNQVLYHPIDLADQENIDKVAKYAVDQMGGVDIFIGNAALELNGMIDSVPQDVIDQSFQVNVASNIALVKKFLPHMRANKWGRVIFSSSATSLLSSAQEGMSVYSASKGAINSYARYAAAEAGHDGITFNSLILGVFKTKMFQEILDGMDAAQGAGAGDEFLKSFSSNIPLGRVANAEDVEGLVQLLASEAGCFITGANVVIDGGMSVMMKANPVE